MFKMTHAIAMLSLVSLPSAADIVLSGELSQGGLMVGKTQPGSTVVF